MATTDVATGNVSGLMAFLDFMIDKGYASASAVNPWKSAAKQVFSTVEGDGYGDFDVRTFDVEEYLSRFETKSMGRYSADSYGAYRSRFRRAVESYRSYLANPNWRPTTRATPRRSAENAGGNEVTGRTAAPSPPSAAEQTTAPSPALIAYPFPLKSGQLAQLQLPAQLHREDADRLTNFIRALVFDQPRQLSPGEKD